MSGSEHRVMLKCIAIWWSQLISLAFEYIQTKSSHQGPVTVTCHSPMRGGRGVSLAMAVARRLEATFRGVKKSEKGYEKVVRALASTIDIP